MTLAWAQPVPLLLACPLCHHRHVDEGEWATKPHRTHLCSTCGHKWQPLDFATVGVVDASRGLFTDAFVRALGDAEIRALESDEEDVP